MRIAFTSCMFTRVFPDQPVWDQIRAQAPDHLVLLGDSTYLDVRARPMPQEMSDDEFAQHLFARYREQMTQPQFAALVASMPPGTVHAIWDDHDFLWDDACGAELNRGQMGLLRLTTAFLEAWRGALARGFAPGSYPSAYNDAAFWNPRQPGATTPTVALAPDVFLHLSDGRTHRTFTAFRAESKRTIFGAAQLADFGRRIAATDPDAIQLWASGSTVAGYQRYERDLAWLMGIARDRRTMVLSGDIHRNATDAFFTPGFPLHEATSSGAAVKDAVEVGATRQNYGLLDIDAQTVSVRVFAKGREETEKSRRFDRHLWRPA